MSEGLTKYWARILQYFSFHDSLDNIGSLILANRILNVILVEATSPLIVVSWWFLVCCSVVSSSLRVSVIFAGSRSSD